MLAVCYFIDIVVGMVLGASIMKVKIVAFNYAIVIHSFLHWLTDSEVL